MHVSRFSNGILKKQQSALKCVEGLLQLFSSFFWVLLLASGMLGKEGFCHRIQLKTRSLMSYCPVVPTSQVTHSHSL